MKFPEIIIVLLVAWLCFLMGYRIAGNIFRNRAIEAGVAKMIVPYEYSTHTKFVFITNNVPVSP